MQLVLKNCPVCQKSDFEEFVKAEDHLITKESFKTVRCINCSFIFTNPRPFEYELGKYYQSEEYDSHKTKSAGLKDILYNVVRDLSTRKKFNYIQSLSTGKTLLDVGAGAGYFLNYCKKKGWEVEGLEPNLKTFPSIDPTIKIHSEYKSIEKGKFDIITMWHSLEHISQIDQTLTILKEALKANGKLIIAVPNIASYDFQHYREKWAALDLPRHLYHFTQESMSLLLNRFNLKVIKVMPMIFDSYYVSLLSEKYSTGKFDYLKAYNIGMKSNQWAKKNNNNYSSLMYTIIKNEVS